MKTTILKANCLSTDTYFHKFTTEIAATPLPLHFTFPFCYEPHLLAKKASAHVQEYILTQDEWTHNFGLDATVSRASYWENVWCFGCPG
ncbi:hypothetical protein ACFX5U_13795 [Sphingobacterium sp. SG20118]|uniref:hypothetical protein n=1 Tax=Sphingobacterium sp. SG20118 TaxID=3367156 RepID=UPI0037DFC04D